MEEFLYSKLTKNFKLAEFLRSETAQRNKIENIPSGAHIENMKALCERVLQPLRDWLGRPVIISSGFRCKKLNELVGGVKNSQHMMGEAADIPVANGSEGRRLMGWIIDNTDFDQCILETNGRSTWIHVSSCRDSKRNRRKAFCKNVTVKG